MAIAFQCMNGGVRMTDLSGGMTVGELVTSTGTVTGVTTVGGGVTLIANRWLHLAPDVGWAGQADVTVRATDPDGQFTEQSRSIPRGP